ncbi:MAG TPA: 3-oxo-tetronate kinase [Jatrophihabitans sp.]|nr:3-oxo-tetronate kinase [Jatrophihabitans sp.]
MTAPLLGVVADDVTGACDLADAVCAEGLSAAVLIGIPARPLPTADCIVVALKSRTAPVKDAVAESVATARRLLDAGCRLLYQKYCSTFDSTERGNIGPVSDALRMLFGESAIAVGTPATPRVARTVYQGHLFVGRTLLSESALRDHPLTPMRDPDLVRVLGRQTSHPVDVITRAALPAVASAVDAARARGVRHVLLDAVDDADLDAAAGALWQLPASGTPLIATGAAGLAAALARTAAAGTGRRCAIAVPALRGRRLIISGSCSARTREQVAAFRGPCVPLDPMSVAADPAAAIGAVCRAVADAFAAGADPVLVSSSAAPEDVAAAAARLGAGRPAELLETASAELAHRAVAELGVRQLLVAGGETSGAVLSALGIGALRVGPAVAPGIAWMISTDADPLAVLLKSGNFGAPELFNTAWDLGLPG